MIRETRWKPLVDEASGASSLVAEAVRDTQGGSAIAVLCGGSLTNEEYTWHEAHRAALGSNHIDNIEGPGSRRSMRVFSRRWAFGGMTTASRRFASAGSIL